MWNGSEKSKKPIRLPGRGRRGFEWTWEEEDLRFCSWLCSWCPLGRVTFLRFNFPSCKMEIILSAATPLEKWQLLKKLYLCFPQLLHIDDREFLGNCKYWSLWGELLKATSVCTSQGYHEGEFINAFKMLWNLSSHPASLLSVHHITVLVMDSGICV